MDDRPWNLGQNGLKNTPVPLKTRDYIPLSRIFGAFPGRSRRKITNSGPMKTGRGFLRDGKKAKSTALYNKLYTPVLFVFLQRPFKESLRSVVSWCSLESVFCDVGTVLGDFADKSGTKWEKIKRILRNDGGYCLARSVQNPAALSSGANPCRL